MISRFSVPVGTVPTGTNTLIIHFSYIYIVCPSYIGKFLRNFTVSSNRKLNKPTITKKPSCLQKFSYIWEDIHIIVCGKMYYENLTLLRGDSPHVYIFLQYVA